MGDPPSGFLLIPLSPAAPRELGEQEPGLLPPFGQENRFAENGKSNLEGAEAAMVETRTESGRRTLAELINDHLAARRAANSVMKEGDARRLETDVPGVAYAEDLLAAAAGEASARRNIIEHEPADRREAMGKLIYISAFLIASQVTLEEREKATILFSVDGF